MSAFLCSPEHISSIVTARAHLRANGRSVDWSDPATIGEAHITFAMLAAENAASVDCRYPRGPRATDLLDVYAFTPVEFPTDPHANLATGHRLSERQRKLLARIINACRCYAYQSCEHEGWSSSEAKRIVDEIVETAAASLARSLDESWEASDRRHFTAA